MSISSPPSASLSATSFCTVPKTSAALLNPVKSAGSAGINGSSTSAAWFVDSPSRQPDLIKILGDSLFVSQLSKYVDSSGHKTEHHLLLNDFCQGNTVNLFDDKFNYSSDIEENVVKFRASSTYHSDIMVDSLHLESSTPIQCLAARGDCVAAVNSSNEVFLAQLAVDDGSRNSESNNDSSFNKSRKIEVSHRYKFNGVAKHQLVSDSSPKCGWVGLNLDPSTIITANYLNKSLMWNDKETGRLISSASLLANPTALYQNRGSALISESTVSSALCGANDDDNCTYVCEGGVFSAWDKRDSNKLAARELVSKETLWTIDKGKEPGNEYDLYLGGVDRNVYVYDIRKWKCRLKWKSPCKYDITKLLLVNSAGNNISRASHFFLGGGDNEVLQCDSGAKYLQLGSAEASNSSDQAKPDSSSASLPASHANLPASSKLRLSHHRGVRSESRWAGLDASWSGDEHGSVVVGMCEMGNYYVLRGAHLMTMANNSNCSSSI